MDRGRRAVPRLVHRPGAAPRPDRRARPQRQPVGLVGSTGRRCHSHRQSPGFRPRRRRLRRGSGRGIRAGRRGPTKRKEFLSRTSRGARYLHRRRGRAVWRSVPWQPADDRGHGPGKGAGAHRQPGRHPRRGDGEGGLRPGQDRPRRAASFRPGGVRRTARGAGPRACPAGRPSRHRPVHLAARPLAPGVHRPRPTTRARPASPTATTRCCPTRAPSSPPARPPPPTSRWPPSAR